MHYYHVTGGLLIWFQISRSSSDCLFQNTTQ